MIIFDGYQLAAQKEAQLREQVAASQSPIGIGAVLFDEDAGSQLYTRLKQQAAERVGISYQVRHFSVTDTVDEVVLAIQQLNQDTEITGIIIQKPTKKVWLSHQTNTTSLVFAEWWGSLVSRIAIDKDVDGLHPETLEAVRRGDWREKGMVLPATCQAVVEVIEQAKMVVAAESNATSQHNHPEKVVIIGVSDLLGTPLFFELQTRGYEVELLTRRQFRQRVESGQGLQDASIIVSATGQKQLITGDLIAHNSIIIDVGEPFPDVNRQSVSQKAALLTPVPGGVGPMTVICLLENALRVSQSAK
ncbi:MAG: bifunctional 5,10-methylenetetrahydrofolate dehydrogenase/5,10-methenyltetrahydrofolate cyclohydrolase [Patescibacteria group bacterium]